jgi:dTDP-4-amino-4,6-dideoxygalactose transaminase
MSQTTFRRQLRSWLGDDVELALFWKGRVALYAILGALDIGPGDEVILPAFTCVAVPSAILYRGARPIYVDIDPETYTIDPARVAFAIGPRTRAILAQNTFGLAPDLDALLTIGRARGIPIIEDCAHGFGGRYRGRPNGTSADVAFFSTQWNKPFTTGLGGIAVTRDRAIGHRLRALERQALAPSRREQLTLMLLAIARAVLLRPATYWPARALFHLLSRHGLVIGSSQPAELESPRQPPRFCKGFSETQARLGIRALARLPEQLLRRRHTAARYSAWLVARGAAPLALTAGAEHGYLRYPVLVEERDRVLAEARRRRLELGDWFLSPVHPIVGRERLERWGYCVGDHPFAEAVSRHVVTLPTHVDEDYAHRLVELVTGGGGWRPAAACRQRRA